MGMGPQLNTVIGGTATNSFVSLAYADTYHLGRFHNGAGWYARDDGDRRALLVWATRLLDRLAWEGSRATSTQALSFPRYGLQEDGIAVLHTVVPVRIQDATCEFAYWLGKSDRMAPETGGRLKDIKLDVLEITFDVDSSDPAPIPKEVMAMLGDWAQNSLSGRMQVRLIRT